MKNGEFKVTRTTKGNPPGLPFEAIKNKILGRDHSLSLVFIADARARALNKTYRRKDKAADVLSFPLDKKDSEIFINLSEARRQAKKNTDSLRRRVGFLFIHGLLHLKGMAHSSKMESEEKRMLEYFGI